MVSPNSKHWLFQRLQALVYLGADSGMIMQIERMGNVTFELMNGLGTNMYNEYTNTLYWDPTTTSVYESDTTQRKWYATHPLAILAHELTHAFDDIVESPTHPDVMQHDIAEVHAVNAENTARYRLFRVAGLQLWPRPGYTSEHKDIPTSTVKAAWKSWWRSYHSAVY